MKFNLYNNKKAIENCTVNGRIINYSCTVIVGRDMF